MKQKRSLQIKSRDLFCVYYLWQLNKIKQVAKRIANIRLTELAYQTRLRIDLVWYCKKDRNIENRRFQSLVFCAKIGKEFI